MSKIEQIYFPDFENVDERMYGRIKETVRKLESLVDKVTESIDNLSRAADSQT